MSLLNGLNYLGTGLAQFAGTAGLEQQKSDLAKQNLMLADQLATNRALNVEQPFQAAQLATTEAGANARTAATVAGSRDVATIGANATLAAEQARAASAERINQATINAPTEQEKLLMDFRVINGITRPGASGGTKSATPSGSGGGSGGSGVTPNPASASQSPSGVPSVAGSAPSGSLINGSSGSSSGDPMSNPIVAKVLGLPTAGSEADIRRKVADGVANDPLFKDQPPDKQALEVEARLAVATGKMIDPKARETLATAIARYQIAPLENFALTKEGANETMSRVMEINPNYQAAMYPEVAKAYAAFGTGPEGVKVQRLDSAMQHMEVLDKAADDMANGNMQIGNSLKNTIARQFGVAAPNTYQGLAGLVAAEATKAVAGGLMSAGERDNLVKSIGSADSPEQIHAMTNALRDLMAGQFQSLKQQYEVSTMQGPDSPFAFERKLSQATVKALASRNSASPSDDKPPANRPPLSSILRPPQAQPSNQPLLGSQ